MSIPRADVAAAVRVAGRDAGMRERAVSAWPARAGAVLALALLLLPLGPACGVSRVQQDRGPGPAALPNLRRASEALQARILREQQHVDAFNRQLAALQSQEERLSELLREAEATYQRLQDDYDFAATDVDLAREQLSSLREEETSLATQRAGLDEALAASRARLLEAEAELARVAALGALAGGQSAAFAAEREAWRARLEAFRVRWSIEPAEWQTLLVELGLAEPAPSAAAPAVGAEGTEATPQPASESAEPAAGEEGAEAESEGESEAGEGGAEPASEGGSA